MTRAVTAAGLLVVVVVAIALMLIARRQAIPFGTRVLLDLPYVSGGDRRQTLDLYLPRGGALSPLIVWVHGGAWESGSKKDPPVIALLADGYAIASLDYRLSSQARFPAQIQDCKAAVRWLRARATQYRLDPRRVAGIGSSAGGHLVALLGTTGHTSEFDVGEHLNVSSRLDAVVDFFGPIDLLAIDSPVLAAPAANLIGGPLSQHEVEARRSNPVSWLTADAPPFLIVHGDRDEIVPLEQSLLLQRALQRAGVPHRLHKLQGGGHDRETISRTLPIVRAFLAEVLGRRQPG
jgi:acetyl esterase/lipase